MFVCVCVDLSLSLLSKVALKLNQTNSFFSPTQRRIGADRANFHMRRKPAQLTLEPVKHEDEGDYRCRVDFKRGRTVNTIISLRVLLLPDDLRIVQAQKPHAKLEGLIGPFNEGSALTLVCLATGGKPRPQISWRRDFNVIDETYQHVNKEGKWWCSTHITQLLAHLALKNC